jgi:peptidylprolyl isomerase
MSEAKQGDTVKVHYTGKLEDGTVFDSSEARGPIEFTIGEKRVIPGFEEKIVGMSPGQKNSFTVVSEQAYGPYMDELILEVDRAMLPENIQPEVGQQLEIRHMDGSLSIVEIINLSDNTVTIDANHPLAGKDLFFDVELVEIAAA